MPVEQADHGLADGLALKFVAASRLSSLDVPVGHDDCLAAGDLKLDAMSERRRGQRGVALGLQRTYC